MNNHEIDQIGKHQTQEDVQAQDPDTVLDGADTSHMMALFKIDYRKLGEDLLQRIERDELYWQRNDAKLRAVTQAQSYEDFRQVVLAAHLKPLKTQEKDAMFNEGKKLDRVLWNATAAAKLTP